MVGPVANRQNAGFQWIKWSEIGWPRLVDIPPERQTTWFARITPVAPPVVVAKTTVDSPSQGDGAAGENMLLSSAQVGSYPVSVADELCVI